MLKNIFFILLLYFSFFILNALEVNKIYFDQTGALKVPVELLKYNIQLKSGRTFSQERLNRDIKQLYDTGYFSDIEAKITTSKNKINISFVLKNTQRIEQILIRGNKKFTTQKIMEHIRLSESDPLSAKLLQESIESIRKLYKDDGYYNVNVYSSTEKGKDGDLILTFHIQENLRLKVNRVIFEGNTVFSDWTLKETVQTSHSYLNWVFNWGLYDKTVAKQDELRLRNLYWTKGYLDFSVKLFTQPVKDDSNYINVIFKIYQGKPYKIGKVTVSGNHVFKDEKIGKLITLKEGEYYDYKKEENIIKSITEIFDNLGYTNFKCKSDLKPDFKTHIVDIVINIKEGRAYNIRNVNISGNKITKDYVIRRELPKQIQPGEPVNNSAMKAGKSRLMAMNYFKKVDAYTTSSPIPGEKDINYEVQEKGTGHASIGAGYSQYNGLTGRLSLSESNFDITDPANFFRGGGQRVNLFLQYGTERQDASLNFVEPWLFGIPLRLDVNGFFHDRTYEYWNERHIGFQFGVAKPFSEFNSWNLGYILDFVNVSDMSDNYSQSFRDREETGSRRGALLFGLQRDTRDSLVSPTSGYLLSFNSELATELLASSSNYYRLDGKASGYWNFFDKFLVLHLGFDIGTVQGIGDPGAVPIYQRYFLGGQPSIRGFQFRRVSPLNSNGMPTGGQSMMNITAEVLHPIYKWIKGAPFVDVGNAWEDPWHWSPNVNVGVGYSLQITIPQISSIPFKLSLGVPVYRTNSDYSSAPQFYIDVGGDW
ncbi:MAG TPA: outer membrane protein assembly factor BamA [Victivallales bacterium]|nr:outer membrane protein assembly factor BamA [Victivallales bacterium]